MTRALAAAFLLTLALGSGHKALAQELTVRSSYTNVVLRTRTTDGRDVCVVAGVHSDGFPYTHPQSRFDNVLLLVGDQAFGASVGPERRRPGQGAGFFLDVDSGEEVLRLRFEGVLRRADGMKVPVDINIVCGLTWSEAITFGLKALPSWLLPPAIGKVGMELRPAVLHPKASTPSAWLNVDGERVDLGRDLIGHLESSVLDNFRSSKFAVTYDYVAAVAPPGENGFAFVATRGRALRSDSYLARIVGKTLDAAAPVRFTESFRRGQALREDGNPFRVRLEPTKVLVSERVDLGLALLDRNLCAFEGEDAQGRPIVLYGLQEVFHPVERGTLRGRIIEAESGRPLAGAFVFVKDLVPGSRTDPSARPIDLGAIRVRTDPEGRFEIDLPMDVYRLTARAPGFESNVVREAFPTTAKESGSEVIIRLRKAAGDTRGGFIRGLEAVPD